MYSRLTKFVKDCNILYDQQYGFLQLSVQSLSVEVVWSQTTCRIPDGWSKKWKPGREGGVNDFGIGGHWGRAFWYFQMQSRGVKMFMPPLVGCGYFLESPKLHECGCY